MRLRSPLFFAFSLLTSCGGGTSHNDTGGGNSTTGTSSGGTGTTSSAATTGTTSGGAQTTSGTGTTGSTTSGGGGGLGCPNAPPENGASCNIESGGFPSAQCSWGDDPRPQCRTLGLCSGGTWSVQEPTDSACDGPPLPASCSAEPPEDGTTCSEANAQCLYDDGTRCTCSPCDGGSAYPLCREIDPPQWWCTAPADGCPVPAPQAGTACDNPDAYCGLDCEMPIVCQDGYWQYGQAMCPICAAPDTPVATPSGEQPISELRVGDLVYTVDAGAIVARPVIRVGSTRVRAHQVLRVVLSTGDTLEMSPGHPTADGRSFSDLAPGDWLDPTHQVVSSTLVPFDSSRTYDILPASQTGDYFASGALVGSTLMN